MKNADTDCTMLLLGTTGVGKSSVGNTILNNSCFAKGLSSSSVTKQCQKQSAVISGKRWTVIDTPDFFYSTHDDDLSSEIKQSVNVSPPGVHAFLFVLKPTTFTEQEADTVSLFKQNYGEEAFRFTIIIFTHGDQIDEDMETLFSENKSLLSLVNHCGGRFHVLNNRNTSDRQQVYQLLQKINNMVSANEKSCYTPEMLQEAQRRAEEQRRIEAAKLNKVKRGNVKVKYVCVIAVCSLVVGAMLNQGSTHPWSFVLGCFLGGSAASVGAITVKFWVMLGKMNPSCSSLHDYSKDEYMKKSFGLLCGGFVGWLIGRLSLGVTPVTLITGLAGASGAFTAMYRSN